MRPYILTLAGFDPSGGAGVLADVKTIEQLGGYGLAVQTANTVQDDRTFKACHWLPPAQIEAQLQLLLDRFPITVVKVGVIEDVDLLHRCLDRMFSYQPTLRVVLDPVLRASTAFDFQEETRGWASPALWQRLCLLTPNADEALRLVPGRALEDAVRELALYTNVLLKGGHRQDAIGVDQLHTQTGKCIAFEPERLSEYGKHGSGCVLSSAIATRLALGDDLEQACRVGKTYVERLLHSNTSALGYHTP